MARQRDDEQTTARRMGIGSRLLLLLAIPLTALMVVTGYGVYRGATQAQDASALTGRTDLALSSYALIEDLQAERALLVAEDRTSPELRTAVRTSADDLALRAGEVGGPLQVQTEAALRRVQAAQSVAERELGGAVALRVYSSAVDQLLDVSAIAIDPGGAIDDAPAATTDYLARAQSAAATERDLVTVLTADDSLDAQSFQEVMSLASAQSSYIELAAASAPPVLAVQIRQVGFANSAADTLRRSVFSGGADRTTPWIEGLDARTADLAELQRTAEVGAVAAVDQLARNSRLLFATAALAALAILLISALLLRRAVRSIARPLQELAVQAEDVARTRLPEAVATQQLDGVEEVHLPALRASGAAEVHGVAQAFNEVQDTALRLASEQAALRRNQGEALTNLGRRNQTLLARQLDFISSLETRETDPAFLDHLFKLDHLASRMRRNAESLLILAGSETPRRRRTPAPISEIVRAAMSEVEEFERVRIGNVRDATIAGPAVIDLIHLLAELIENALGFSPPETTVEIDGRSLGQGGYQFAVIDHGVGMTDVELLAANHRLRGLDELEGMPTRYLGQYVVAKLAAKTGALVRLQPTAGGRGVTALVILPISALVGERDRDAVAQPLPGSRAAREQGPVPFAPGAAVAPAIDAPALGGDTFADLGAFSPAPVDAAAHETVEVGLFGPGPSSAGEPVEATSHDTSEFDSSGFDAAGFVAEVPGDDIVVEDAVPDETAFVETAFEDTAFVDAAFDDITFERSAFASGGTDRTDEDATDPGPATATEVAPAWVPMSFEPDAEASPEVDEVIGDTADANPSAATGADLPDVTPWIAERREVSPDADPWQAFLSDDEPLAGEVDEPVAGEAMVPPPAPPAAPVQPGWVPAAVDPAPAPPPAPMPADPVPSLSSAPHAAPLSGSTGRPGGLARRVPGASLAESRGRDVGAASAPAHGRSADGVRSMLSSFQAGRHRGRVDGEPEPGALATELAPTPSNPSDADPAPDHPNSVHDGRFPQ
jgi:signal transduction histidine kinase